MAAPQELAAGKEDQQLKREAIARAALLIRGMKLIASVMDEIDSRNGSTLLPTFSGNFVLYPSPDQPARIETVLDLTPPSTSSPIHFARDTTDPIEFTEIDHALGAFDNEITLRGATTTTDIDPTKSSLQGTQRDFVFFDPDKHQLALYVDEKR